MKLTSNRRSVQLPTDNMHHILEVCKAARIKPEAVGLLVLIANLFDDIGKGEDVYMTIGAVRDRTSYVVTVTLEGEKSPIYGEDIEDINFKAIALADDASGA